MEDPTPLPTTIRALLYLQLIQQLIELQKENIELRKEGIYNQPSGNNYTRKLEKPTIALVFSWQRLGPIHGHMGLIQDVPANKPDCNPEQA